MASDLCATPDCTGTELRTNAEQERLISKQQDRRSATWQGNNWTSELRTRRFVKLTTTNTHGRPSKYIRDVQLKACIISLIYRITVESKDARKPENVESSRVESGIYFGIWSASRSRNCRESREYRFPQKLIPRIFEERQGNEFLRILKNRITFSFFL